MYSNMSSVHSSSVLTVNGYSDEMLGKWKKYQGLKKVPSGCLGQEDLPAGLVNF